MRSLTREVLEQRGHKVTEAPDGETGWACWQQEAFPLVVVDWTLPGMDGLALCRRIRSSPQGDATVVLISIEPDHPDDIQAVLDAGANDCIAKPFTRGLLRVRLAVAERQVHTSLEQQHAEAQLTYQALHDRLT